MFYVTCFLFVCHLCRRNPPCFFRFVLFHGNCGVIVVTLTPFFEDALLPSTPQASLVFSAPPFTRVKNCLAYLFVWPWFVALWVLLSAGARTGDVRCSCPLLIAFRPRFAPDDVCCEVKFIHDRDACSSRQPLRADSNKIAFEVQLIGTGATRSCDITGLSCFIITNLSSLRCFRVRSSFHHVFPKYSCSECTKNSAISIM